MNTPSRELPLSTFDPAPNTRCALDYRDVIAECDRILVKIGELKADLFSKPVGSGDSPNRQPRDPEPFPPTSCHE